MAKKRLGEILIEEGVINDLQLATALGDQKQWGGKIGEILLRLKMVTEEDLAYALQARLKVKWLSLKEMQIQEAIVKLIPEETAKKFLIMPVGIKKTTLYVAMTDPTDLQTLDTLSFNLGMQIKPVIATQSDIKWAIARYYDKIMPEEDKSEFRAGVQAEPTAEAKSKSERLKKRIEQDQFQRNLKGLMALLVEKKIITQDELAQKISEFEI